MAQNIRLRLQIIVINYLVPLFIGGICREIIVSLFNIHMEKDVLGRILFALNKPMVYGLMIFISTIINIIILSQMKPLFRFLDSGEMETKARKSTLSTPWILILVHTLAWIIGTTALYAFVFKWNSPGGVKYIFSVLFSTSMGLLTAVMGALLLNIVLLPAKHQLNMVHIRKGERDSFIRIKYYIILVTVLVSMGLSLFHASRFIADRRLYSLSSIIFTAIIVFYGIWAAVLIFLARKEDLYQARQMLERIHHMNSQEGDLSQFITLINFDEVGKISNDLNIFITKLKEIVTEINNESQILGKTGKNLSNHIQETSKSIQGNNNSLGILSQEAQNYTNTLSTSFDSIQNILAGINSLKDSITEQAAGIEESGATINSMIKYTQKNSAVMKQMESAFENLMQISQNGEKKIDTLNQSLNKVLEQSTRLQETNKVISSIAARTNLLAMNAAIEAAHAENAGSGFAVVASEVRTLAENAARESSNVNNELKKTMAYINGAAGDAEESLKSFHEIKEKINSAYDLEQSILRSFEEQNAGSQQVITALSEMNSISASVQETASNLSSETESVDKTMKNMDEISRKLSIDIKRLSAETESVSRRVEEMTQISLNNSENIRNIKASITRFKIES